MVLGVLRYKGIAVQFPTVIEGNLPAQWLQVGIELRLNSVLNNIPRNNYRGKALGVIMV